MRRLERPYDLARTARYFDRFGALLTIANLFDRAAYERFAIDAELARAGRVFELGPGRGMLARSLLRGAPRIERWVLAEVSAVLHRHLLERVAAHDARAQPFHVATLPPYPYRDGSFDRFVSCFVLDCMDRRTQVVHVEEAHRLLDKHGMLCTMSVTRGRTLVSRWVMGLGNLLSRCSPALALGARFIELRPALSPELWSVQQDFTITSMGFSTRIIVARKRAADGAAERADDVQALPA